MAAPAKRAPRARTARPKSIKATVIPERDEDDEVVDEDDYLGPGSDEPFTYESTSGTIVVPSLSKMPKPKGLAMLRIQAEKDPVVREAMMILTMLQNAAGEGTAALRTIGQLDYEELGEFMSQWAEHSGVGAGE